MSEEKKELKKNLKNEELCEGKQKLSIDELEQVTGGTLPDFINWHDSDVDGGFGGDELQESL